MAKLEEKKINDLFGSCFFEEDEIINGRPLGNFTSVKSINPDVNMTVALSTDKLNKNKTLIIEYLDSLSNIEEGNNLEGLYYDSEGNEWCSDIKTLDQLMMLALACNLIEYNVIEFDGEEIIKVKRIKDNDKVEVKGISPEVLPEVKDNQLSRGFTEEEKKIISENKNRITEELINYNEVMNIGLGFYGISVKINKDNLNQLDFYDRDGNLLFQRKFEDTTGIVGWEAVFNQRLSCEFKDQDKNKINYLVDRKRHIFLLSAYKEKNYGYRVEITTDDTLKKYSRIKVSVTDAKADCIIKNFEIDAKDLKVEVNNHFGPYGNGGLQRLLWYRDTITSNKPLLFMEEEVGDYTGHNLIGDESGIRVDESKFVDCLSNMEFYNLATNIARHPRNRELILYTIEAINEVLPVVKDFISKNFPLYKFLTDFDYIDDSITNAIVEATIYGKCNLIKKNKVLEKKTDEN